MRFAASKSTTASPVAAMSAMADVAPLRHAAGTRRSESARRSEARRGERRGDRARAGNRRHPDSRSTAAAETSASPGSLTHRRPGVGDQRDALPGEEGSTSDAHVGRVRVRVQGGERLAGDAEVREQRAGAPGVLGGDALARAERVEGAQR